MPIDLRSEATRMRAVNGIFGDFEHMAGRIVARFLGEEVLLIDDGSDASMVDLEIRYKDRASGFVEVVTNTDRLRAATYEEIRRREFRLSPFPLKRHWQIEVRPGAHLGRMNAELPPVLTELEQTGISFDRLEPIEESDLPPEHRARLRTLGVSALVCWVPPQPGTQYLQLFPEGIEGLPETDWLAFDAAVASILSSPELSDVRAKLISTGADERHGFIGITMASPWCLNYWLAGTREGIPDQPPNLPSSITHLWLWSADLRSHRVLAWFPDRGWFDPSLNWATP